MRRRWYLKRISVATKKCKKYPKIGLRAKVVTLRLWRERDHVCGLIGNVNRFCCHFYAHFVKNATCGKTTLPGAWGVHNRLCRSTKAESDDWTCWSCMICVRWSGFP